MEYSKEETEDWFRGGELPDKNTKLGIKEYIFDYEYHSSKGENVVLLRLSYQQGKEVVRVTKEIIEK